MSIDMQKIGVDATANKSSKVCYAGIFGFLMSTVFLIWSPGRCSNINACLQAQEQTCEDFYSIENCTVDSCDFPQLVRCEEFNNTEESKYECAPMGARMNTKDTRACWQSCLFYPRRGKEREGRSLAGFSTYVLFQ